MIFVDRSNVTAPEHLLSARVQDERERMALLIEKSGPESD